MLSPRLINSYFILVFSICQNKCILFTLKHFSIIVYYLRTLKQILSAYNTTGPEIVIEPHGTGLINNTWKVGDGDAHYILQRINDNIFKHTRL